ncbi:MAG: DUF1295 domain-containing protein [Clostridiales bacterium]|nr:DUF1295 domain-containing protein [Clostridiales bacterium]
MLNLIYVFMIIFCYFIILFIIGQILNNNSIVDIFWGMGFVLTAWTTFALGSKGMIALLTTLLVTIWGVRLTYHIGKRNIGKPEDFRYVNFRKLWGKKFPRIKAFFHVYMLQMVFLLMISSGFMFINLNKMMDITTLSLVGLVVWFTGFLFETVGDHQLQSFKSNQNNKGKLLVTGLYRYTRHPNYFGESLMWWGIFIMALSFDYAWVTILSPITITLLVRFVSGVPMLEKHYKDRADYQDYARKTSIFFPWFPKK